LIIVLMAPDGYSAELSGTVYNTAGEPAAAAPVRLLTSDAAAAGAVDLGRTTTDAAGRFHVEVPDSWIELPEMWRGELKLLAKSADGDVGGVLVSRTLPLPRQSLTIRLEAWSQRKVAVVDAEDKPLAGVKLRIAGLFLPIVMPPPYAPEAGQTQLAMLPVDDGPPQVTTDDNGIADLLLPPMPSVGALRAELAGNVEILWSVYGNQTAVPQDWSQRVVLPKLKPVPLQVEAPSKAALADLNLTVVSRPQTSNGPNTIVNCRPHLSDDGRSTLQVLNEGFLIVYGAAPNFPDLRVDPQFVVNSDTLGEKGVKLRLRNGVAVTGRAVASDGRPAADTALFAFSGFSSPTRIRTDADGRFRFTVERGQFYVVPSGLSSFRGLPFDQNRLIAVPEKSDEFAMPDLELVRLHTLSGTVRDENRQPVAGASVVARWDEPHPQVNNAITNREAVLSTDADGHFAVNHVDPHTAVKVTAWKGGMFTPAIQSIAANDHDKPVELAISDANAIAVAGRVVDSTGQGIANLPVIVRHRLVKPQVYPTAPTGEDLPGGDLLTNQEGQFATARAMPPWGAYIVLVRAGRPQETVSGWKVATDRSPLQFPDIVAAAVAEISGRVMTAQGAAIRGADVILLTSDDQSRARSDEDGRFTLAAIGGRGPLLVASADGFLSNGIDLSAGGDDIVLTLPQAAELAAVAQPGERVDRPLPGLSTDQRRELAIRLSKDFPPRNQQMRAQVYSALARIAPGEVLSKLDDLPANALDGVMVRRSLALTLAETKPTEGLELLEQLPNAIMKQMALMNFEVVANLEPDERRQLLARIVQDVRGMKAADHRIVSMGLLGERLIDLGERETGEALLREWQPSAEKLAPAAFSGYVRGAFAEELSQFDADAALKLIEPLTDVSEFNRHLTNIAHELAAIDPARAAALLDQMRPPDPQQQPIASYRDLAAVRVCYRMVRVDADRAIAVADSLESDVMRIHCRGLMAESLLKQDGATADSRALADRLLTEAWQMLSEYGRTQDQAEVAYLFPSTMAALLLPLTAELHPERLPHRVWQAISLMRPMVKSGAYRYAGQNGACELSLLLADVDPGAARRVLAWTPGAAEGETAFAEFVQYSRTAPELIVTLTPETIDASLKAIQNQEARERLALQFLGALSRSGESRQRAIRGNVALWFPDDEDLGPQD
jgi:hypothetical protein